MSSDSAKPFILQAQAALASAMAELSAAPPPPPTSVITTAPDFDKALSAAIPYAVLTLSRSLIYPAPLTLRVPVTLQGETYAVSKGTRAKVDEQIPTFMAGITSTADDVHLLGIGAQHTNPLTDIVVIGGLRPILDRVCIMGDPIKGAKRGIAYSGTNGNIVNAYIDNIFQPAQDTQAICAWDMGPGLIIDNSYLCAAGQSVMFGGADPISAARIPTGIRLTGSTLTKNPAWVVLVSPGKHVQQVKCALELKDVIDFQASGCELEYAGTSMGQGAYLIDLTPRNQGGKAPFTTVQDVVIQNCTGKFAAGIVNMLGSDNVNPSGPLIRVTLQNLSFTNIDPQGPTSGSGRLFMFDRSPQNITLDTITVAGANIAALGYFNGVAPKGLIMNKLTLPPSKYGWKIDAGGSGRVALQAYAPDAVMDGSIV